MGAWGDAYQNVYVKRYGRGAGSAYMADWGPKRSRGAYRKHANRFKRRYSR